MNPETIKAAAHHFVLARRGNGGASLLPPELKPVSVEECHAIQDATVVALNEAVGGWKVSFDKSGVLVRAPILQRTVLESPARVPIAMARLGIEAEIAFRFTRALPVRSDEYSREQVVDAIEAFAAIELLDLRYATGIETSAFDKIVDFAVNGGIVCAAPRPDWRSVDFSRLDVALSLDGRPVVRATGSHADGDPVIPAVALVNALRTSCGVKAGQIMTTGSWTGATPVMPSNLAVVAFGGFAPVSVEFTA